MRQRLIKKPYQNWQQSSKEDQWKQEQEQQRLVVIAGRETTELFGWVVALLPAANPKTQCFSKEEGFKMGTSFRSPVWKPEINIFCANAKKILNFHTHPYIL
jgi:hypothetical protein